MERKESEELQERKEIEVNVVQLDLRVILVYKAQKVKEDWMDKMVQLVLKEKEDSKELKAWLDLKVHLVKMEFLLKAFKMSNLHLQLKVLQDQREKKETKEIEANEEFKAWWVLKEKRENKDQKEKPLFKSKNKQI